MLQRVFKVVGYTNYKSKISTVEPRLYILLSHVFSKPNILTVLVFLRELRKIDVSYTYHFLLLKILST